jgi:hypothetical protein
MFFAVAELIGSNAIPAAITLVDARFRRRFTALPSILVGISGQYTQVKGVLEQKLRPRGRRGRGYNLSRQEKGAPAGPESDVTLLSAHGFSIAFSLRAGSLGTCRTGAHSPPFFRQFQGNELRPPCLPDASL